MQGYHIKIKLKDYNLETFRKIIVPENISFQELDDVFKTIWGLKGLHLSKFIIDDGIVISDINFSSFDDLDVNYDSKTVFIKDFFSKYDKIRYIYNLSEKWQFIIEIISKVNYTHDYVTLTGFKGKWNLIEDLNPGLFKQAIYYKQHPENVDFQLSSLYGFTFYLNEFDAGHIQGLLKEKVYVKYQFTE